MIIRLQSALRNIFLLLGSEGDELKKTAQIKLPREGNSYGFTISGGKTENRPITVSNVTLDTTAYRSVNELFSVVRVFRGGSNACPDRCLSPLDYIIDIITFQYQSHFHCVILL